MSSVVDPEALGRRVRELEAELRETRRLSAAKDAFVATVSHELRSPLHSILGHIELLREHPASTEDAEHLRAAHRSARGLLNLLNDLLDMAALGNGSFSLRPTDTLLRELFAEILAAFQPTASAQRLDLTFTCDPSVPLAVLVDGQRLGQIVTNLVANALRFTDEGGVEIRLSCPRANDAWIDLSVEVIDSGVGVPPEARDRLFTPFAQVHQPSPRRGGTGLGLAICQKLVERMAGRIGYSPRSPRGSNFWIEVPLLRAEAPQPLASALPAPPPLAASRHRLLVVEDTDSNRLWAQRALSSRGFSVTLAESGYQALAILAYQTFDAILMDWHMPDMDGLQTTRAIRSLGGSFATVPILGLSASALPDTVARCREAGMNECLLKPISIHALIHALQRLLSRASPVASLPPASLAASLPPASLAASLPPTPPAPTSSLAVQLDDLPLAVCVELAELFAQHVTERAAQLEQALLDGDATTIARHAHAIASTASGIHRLDLCSQAQALELRVSQGAPSGAVEDEARQLIAAARHLAPRVLEATRALVRGGA